MNKLYVSKEIEDTIDESQFDTTTASKSEPTKSVITANFYTKDEQTVSGILEKHNLKFFANGEFKYCFKILVLESMVKDFVDLMAAFTSVKIFVDGDVILERGDLEDKGLVEFGIEQDLINTGATITIAYQ